MFKPTFISLAILLCSSCIKDDLEKLTLKNWDPEVAMPLIDSRFKIDRILKNAGERSDVVYDGKNTVTLLYRDKLFNINGNQIVRIYDLYVNATDTGIYHELPIVNRKISHLDLGSGKLSVRVEADLSESTNFTLTIPKATKNGFPYSLNFSIEIGNPRYVIFEDDFDINGYHFDLTGPNGDENNLLNFEFTARTVSSNQVVPLDLFRIGLTEIKYDYLDGYFGVVNLGEFVDTLKLPVFANFKAGNLLLEAPKLNLHIENGYGLPVEASIVDVKSSKLSKKNFVHGNFINRLLNIDSQPDSTGRQLFPTDVHFDKSNSNLVELLSISPQLIIFDFNFDANLHNDSTDFNYIFKSSELLVNAELEIPFEGKFDSVIVEDIYRFDPEVMGNASSAMFKLSTENSFPLNIYFQIYFVNIFNFDMDSLLPKNKVIFRRAMTDDNGISNSITKEELFFDMDENRYKQIRRQAKNIRIRAMLISDNTTNKNSKITSEDFFGFKLGAIARIHREK